jgi:hypothetical protein
LNLRRLTGLKASPPEVFFWYIQESSQEIVYKKKKNVKKMWETVEAQDTFSQLFLNLNNNNNKIKK